MAHSGSERPAHWCIFLKFLKSAAIGLPDFHALHLVFRQCGLRHSAQKHLDTGVISSTGLPFNVWQRHVLDFHVAELKPVRIPLGSTVLYFSSFSDFSVFAYPFRRIQNSTIYKPQHEEGIISGSDQACFVCARPSNFRVGLDVLCVLQCAPIV